MYIPVPGKSNHLTIVDPKFYAEDFVLFYPLPMKKEPYGLGVKNWQKQKNWATTLLSLKADVSCCWCRKMWSLHVRKDVFLNKTRQIMGRNSLPTDRKSGEPGVSEPTAGNFQPKSVFFSGRIWPKAPKIWTSLRLRWKADVGSVSSPVLYDFARQRVLFLLVSRVNSSLCHTKSLQESQFYIIIHVWWNIF